MGEDITTKEPDQQLIQEQEKVQLEKIITRSLEKYDALIFPTLFYKGEQTTCPVQDFMDSYCGVHVTGIEGLLERIRILRARQIVWADMGGGIGLAMRQVFSHQPKSERAVFLNVDLFDYDRWGLSVNERLDLARDYPGLWTQEVRPELLMSNSETVALPKPADIITSVEMVQYLNDPLAAICNWYNQLADHGILIIAAEHDWSRWIRIDSPTGKPYPMRIFETDLVRAGIPFSANKEEINENNYKLMVIRKKPNTEMELQSKVKNIWTSPKHYKAVYYDVGELVVKVGVKSGTDSH